MKDPRNLLIVALVIALAALFWDRHLHAGNQGGGGDNDRGLIAVTGTYGSGASALYLIDTKTRHLAAYRLDNGRSLEFVAARDCSFDFFLETYQDQSPPSMLPGSLRKSWQRFSTGETTPPVIMPGEAKKLDSLRAPGGVLPPPPSSLAPKAEKIEVGEGPDRDR